MIALKSVLSGFEVLSKGSGIPEAKTPWAGSLCKPDFVLDFKSIIVVLECDDDSGHSGSRGNRIEKYGDPWKYARDLNAERAKMMLVSRELSKKNEKILYIRANSDNESLNGSDPGCVKRAQDVAKIIIAVEADPTPFPDNCFRLSLVDMPAKRYQEGCLIPNSSDVFISWDDVQQTINPTDPATLRTIAQDKTRKQKQRRAEREQ